MSEATDPPGDREGGDRRAKSPAPQAGRPASADDFWTGGRGVPRRGKRAFGGMVRVPLRLPL